MVQTITTDFQFVTDGETTVENPGSIVGNENIIISNAEIQWQGTTETSSSTSYSTSTNSGSATATSSTSTSYNTNSVSGSATATTTTSTKSNLNTFSTNGGDGGTITAPSIPSNATFKYHTMRGIIENNSGNDDRIGITFDNVDGTQFSDSQVLSPNEKVYFSTTTSSNNQIGNSFQIYSTQNANPDSIRTVELRTYYDIDETVSDTVTLQYPSVPSGYSFDRHTKTVDGDTDYIYTNNVGNSVSATSNDPNNTVNLTLTTRGADSTTTVNSDTTTVSYPSVPSGHSFDRHYYREEKNGSFVDSDYIYTNKVGDTRSVTSNDPSNTWELTMQTRGEQTVTTTTETQDLSVSGDVSAAYNGTLGSQEYSSWQPLSGFELGDNSFVHDIGGTNEAFYQIRFDYELSFPTTVAEAYIHVGNTTYPVILADPSDPNLVYDFYRVNHPTHGELAFDVVNTTNADATPYTVTDGNGNVRALRENTQ